MSEAYYGTGACYHPVLVSQPEGEAALHYHELTKHSPASVHANRHSLDWANQPLPFKIYTTLDPIPLPSSLGPTAANALEALGPGVDGAGTVNREALARLFYFSAGVTRTRRYSGGEMLFRAAACTGALYHIELYAATGELPDLEAGVYHFSAHDFALRRLRSGDHRGVMAAATGDEPTVTAASTVVIVTSTFWRNSWKYQARAYRHSFWDGGTIVANLLAVARALEIPARLVVGFADESVARLLGVDTAKEGVLALLSLGSERMPTPSSTTKVPEPISHPTRPLSLCELEYTPITEAHRASSLASGEEARVWCSPRQPRTDRRVEGIPLQARSPAEAAAEPLETVIRRRGSTRRFAGTALSFGELSTALYWATRGLDSDYGGARQALLNQLYLIVNSVEGLASGTYALGGDGGSLEELGRGDFRRQAAHLALGQDLGGDAAACVYVMCDLEEVMARFGSRGYRAAGLEGGILGGKLYLAAYAQGFGATGLTFYDDEVTRFFSPHAARKSVMFLCALGRPARASRRG
jgi:SagB-type dehydrogenase family enzyme